jgi:hypothetical protein
VANISAYGFQNTCLHQIVSKLYYMYTQLHETCNKSSVIQQKLRKKERIFYALLPATVTFGIFYNYQTSTNTLVLAVCLGQQVINSIKFYIRASLHEGYVQKYCKLILIKCMATLHSICQTQGTSISEQPISSVNYCIITVAEKIMIAAFILHRH